MKIWYIDLQMLLIKRVFYEKRAYWTQGKASDLT